MTQTKKITYASFFLALALVLPFVTGQIPQIGSMLCPMHLPVLLCGYICGAPYGLLIGFLAPILRSLTLSMPPMFPTAFCMAFELATYGFFSGTFIQCLPKRKYSIYISLILSMILGRVVWGIIMFMCMGLDTSKFGFQVFLAGAFTNAIPGILLQSILIPILIILIKKNYRSSIQ